MSGTKAQPSEPGTASDPKAAWLPRSEIAAIKGALKPSAYVGRAYTHQRAHGELPAWARKTDSGQWEFARDYLEADARTNQLTIGVTEAARRVGATRRAIQTWVDEGVIESLAGPHDKGAARQILREPFMRQLNALQRRVERPAVVAQKQKRGHAIDPQVLARLESDQAAKAERLERQRQRRQQRAAARLAKRQQEQLTHDSRLSAQLEAQLKAAQEEERRLAREAADTQRSIKSLATKQARFAAKAKRLQQTLRNRLRSITADEAAIQRTLLQADKQSRAKTAAAAAAARRTRTLQRKLEARAATQRDAVVTQPSAAPPAGGSTAGDDVPHQQRARSAEALAARLREAQAINKSLVIAEREAETIAQRLCDDMASGLLDRYDAAILFNDIANQRNFPDDIRIKITKQYFSR